MAGVLLAYECIISGTHVTEFISIYVLRALNWTRDYWATSNLRICFVYHNNATQSKPVIVHNKRKIFPCLTRSSDTYTRQRWHVVASELTRRYVRADGSVRLRRICVVCLILACTVWKMVQRMSSCFDCHDDETKKSTPAKITSITLCLVSSSSRGVLVWSALVRSNKSEFFHQQLRVIRNTFNCILNILHPHLDRQQSHFRDPLPLEKILALGLYHLGHGNSYVSIGPSFNVGKATIIEVVQDVVEALYELRNEHIKFPVSEEETCVATETFEGLSDLPNIVGAIDIFYREIFNGIQSKSL